jgi:hypothetical protein
MLYANIAGIVNSRYQKERIITKPDYELFYSMVVDPTDTVCDIVSPLRDLKSRADVQYQLWNNVYNLRNGKYYEATSIDFVANIDKCRISNVDNPDILYLSDEGVILRRLFAIFAYRPIIVQTIPISGMIVSNPLNIPHNTNSITSIPYITYKLPGVQTQGQQYSLNDANNQIQFYMENGSFVPKATQIVDVRGPLIFYVPRRSMGLPMKIANPQISPFGVADLANTTREYQQVNEVELSYDNTIQININLTSTSKTYFLRSAVAFEKYDNTSIILGHMTFLFKYARNADQSIMSADPMEIVTYIPRKANLIKNNGYPILSSNAHEAKRVMSTCGTIFVYNQN